MPNNQIKSLTVQGVTYDIVDKTSGYLTSSSNLDATKLTGTVPTAALPSYVDDVLEYSSQSGFPAAGETGKIYVDTSTNLTYRWSGSTYVEISPSLALGETSSTAYRGDYGAAAYAHAVTNKGSAFASGLYKITTNFEGHVTAASAVQKSDITGLGIPGSDTTYTFDGTYDASTNKAATVSTVTNAISNATLAGLSDTTVSSPSNGQILQYDSTSSKWVNGALPSDIMVVNLTGTQDQQTGDYTYTADKTYAQITAHINNGGYVVCNYNGARFELDTVGYDYVRFRRTGIDNNPDVDGMRVNATTEDIEINQNNSVNSYHAYSLPFYITSSLSDGDILVYDEEEGFINSPLPTIPTASSTTPSMDGTAAVGSSTTYARADHVHPSDTSKANTSDVLTKTNTTSFTPTGDYHPATKKYVDDSISGFSTTLSGLSDTTISSPSAGQALVYDNSTSKWVNSSVAASISISSNVITLTNANGTTSTVTLPVYNGGVTTV